MGIGGQPFSYARLSVLTDATATEAAVFGGADTAGTQLNLANDGGRTRSLLSDGSATTGGVGKLLIRDETATATRATVETNGDLGLGTTTPAARLDVAGTVKLGTTGTALAAVIRATANRNLPSIGSNSTSVQTFTVANAAVGALVLVSPQTALTDGLVMQYARVSAANTVEVKFYNRSNGSIDEVAMDFYITVIQ